MSSATMSADVPTGNARLIHPRHDKDFGNRILWDLITHAGEYRQLGRTYASHIPSFDRCCIIREFIDRARRLGFVIDGDRRRGYCLRDFKLPERVYLVCPGDYQREQIEPVDPDQLTLSECPGVVSDP